MIRRGDTVVVAWAAHGADPIIRRESVTHVTLHGDLLLIRGEWFSAEEEGESWATLEHESAFRVTLAL